MNDIQAHDYGMPVHPVCDLLPLMDEVALTRLRDDIREKGVVVPIVVHAEQLIDGRNRVLACKALNLTPPQVEWRSIYHGDLTVTDWIESVNEKRRDLTQDQHITFVIAARLHKETEAAKLNQVVAGKVHGGPKTKRVVTNRSQAVPKPQRAPAVRTKLAKELGVSERKVQQVLTVDKKQPELLKEVIRGKVSLREAAKQVSGPSPKKRLSTPRITSTPNALCTNCRLALEEFQRELRSIVQFISDLRKELTRKRKASNVRRNARIWYPDNVNKDDLVKIIDWFENELDVLTSAAGRSTTTRNKSVHGIQSK
ncbi:ParB N-terminal domain-containing protein [Acidobacterium sp. S8]|uniref:ParB N-terminal domain-containing protein n=1 Tax=Acidobacterium sp. S8 TaxID=1641854 RepID=UPI00131ADC66|nr:ParB N-terminal domain-containing protein [Acidobacterium sp. S8]